jgi:hypothetical protein
VTVSGSAGPWSRTSAWCRSAAGLIREFRFHPLLVFEGFLLGFKGLVEESLLGRFRPEATPANEIIVVADTGKVPELAGAVFFRANQPA